MPTLIAPTFPLPRPPRARARPIAFPPAPFFDFQSGDFIRNYAGELIMTDGYTAWQQWCMKTLQTQQAAYAIYPRSHGIHLAALRNNWPRPVVEADLRNRISYALTRSRRTASVGGFVFDWSQPNVVQVSCVPVPAQGSPFRLVNVFNF